MMPFDGIIFDFNGVLWLDAPLVERGWQRAAMQLRGRPLSPEEFARIVHGRNSRDTTIYLAGRPLDDGEIRRLIDEREAAYRELCVREGENFRLSPGAEELLSYLKAHGIPRTIATASEKMNVDFFVDRLGLERWFDPEKIVFDDGVRPGKPAPDIYLQAAANLALDPSRCVVVEDSLSGLRAARAAGIGYVVALGYASVAGGALKDIPVDAAVRGLGQLDRRGLFGGGRTAAGT